MPGTIRGSTVYPIPTTALLTAADRARESRRPDRLFEDPLAAILAGEAGPLLLRRMPQGTGEVRVTAIRTRFFDDWMADACRRGIAQIVILGAGMDARAFRLRWPPGTVLWELDRPALLDAKRALLNGNGAQPLCDRRELAVDLRSDGWSEQLKAAGFRAELPSAWLAEGLLVYLRGTEAERLIRQVAASASPGSAFGADFVSGSFLRGPWMQPYLAWLAEQGAPCRFGTDRPEDVLTACGWRAPTVRQPGEEGAGAGLLPWDVVPRDVVEFPRNFLVTAER